jgi:pimeloyl-ACP methyl ester carboxylesterase
MPFVVTSRLGLHFTESGDGPPLFLIAGFRQNGGAWPEDFILRLATRHRVIALDNRGTGLSDKPASGYDLHEQAADTISLLDALRLPRTHVLGFSMGGGIAQEMATRFPGRIDRLVLFATFCGGIWSHHAPWSVLRRLFAVGGLSPEQAARQAWEVTYTPAYLAAHASAVEQQMYRELAHPTPEFVAKRQMNALWAFDCYHRLPRIDAATLVTTGTHDRLVKPSNSRILASRIPGSRLEALADLGHRAIWEAPEEIAGFVADFLAGPVAGRTYI